MIEGWPEKKNKYKNKNKLPAAGPPVKVTAKLEDGNNNPSSSSSSSNLYFPFHDNSIIINNIPGNDDHQFLLRDHHHHHQGSSSLVLPELQPIFESQPTPLPQPDFCNWLFVRADDKPADFGGFDDNNNNINNNINNNYDHYFRDQQQFGLDIVGNGGGGGGGGCTASTSSDLCDWLLSDDVVGVVDQPFLDFDDDFFNGQGQGQGQHEFALLDTLAAVNECPNNGNHVVARGKDEGTSSGVNGENASHHHHHLPRESHVNVYQNCPGNDNNNNNSSSSNSLSGFGSPVLEALPAAADCTDLLPPPYILLREISHSNGNQVRNLEIYGLIGMISYGILYKIDPSSSPGNLDYQLFNFSEESLSNVRSFLIQYCEDCKKEGFWMVQDSFFEFYQTLCVGINVQSGDNTIIPQPFVPSGGGGGSSSIQEHSTTSYQQEITDRNGVKRSKINLSKQRERTGKLKLKDFSMYFDLRITDVAEKLNVCPTVVKKKCREAGLNRWPYRKIKGLKRKIKAKRDCLMIACSDAERSQNLLEIQVLEEQLQDIYTKLGQLQM